MIVEPASIDEVAEILARASRDGRRVAIRGGGTKLGGDTSPPPDVVLSTSRLNAVVAHRDGDLTATVQAGATLAETNRVLARHRQWIPLDPPWSDRATIGGIVATNDSGPRRHRYGAPRDLIIGIDIVLADGTVAKAGGIVVKNVAGYDVSRLMTGSFGSLAVIASATFKLYPVPPASRTVVVDPGRVGASVERPGSANASVERMSEFLAALANAQLTPTAIELQVPPGRLLVRFETIDVAAREQAAAVETIARQNRCDAEVVAADVEAAMWDEHGRRPWQGEGAVVKVTLLPTEIPPLITWLAEAAREDEWELVGRGGAGVLLVRVAGDVRRQAEIVDGLRQRLPVGRGSAVVVRGSNDLRALIDRWGPLGDALPLMREIKRRFDPAGVLNPSAGPGGL
jgi:glycolate oxidase FAD binding subunit